MVRALLPNPLARNASVYLLTTAVQRAAPFLALPLLTRLLSTADVGRVGVTTSLAQFVAMVSGGGLAFGMGRLVYDEPLDSDRTVWSATLIAITTISLLLAVLLWFTGPLWSRALGEVEWGLSLQSGIVLAFGLSILRASQSVLRALRRVRAFALATISSAIGGVALGIVAIRVIGGAGSYISGLGIGAVGAGTGALLAACTRPDWHWLRIRNALTLSLPFIGHAAAVWALNGIDRILVERYLGLEAAGDYYVAYLLGTATLLLLDALHSAWTPDYYEAKHQQKRSLSRRVGVHATWAATFGAAILAALSPWLLPLVFPDARPSAILTMIIAAAATVTRPLYYLSTTALIDAKRGRGIMLSSVAAAVANVLLNILLIPIAGIVGAAAATLVSFAVLTSLILWWARRDAVVDLPSPARIATHWILGTVMVIAFGLGAQTIGLGLGLSLCALSLLGMLRSAHRTAVTYQDVMRVSH